MTKGFDCSTPLTAQTAAAFVKDGYSFVARYLVPSGYKALTKSEAERSARQDWKSYLFSKLPQTELSAEEVQD